MKTRLSETDQSRVIEMAWEDRTPFDAIFQEYGLTESDVIAFMSRCLKRKTFKNWRERVSGRKTKHLSLRTFLVGRAYCPTQYKSK